MSKISTFYQNFRNLFSEQKTEAPKLKVTEGGKTVPFTSTAATETPEFAPLGQTQQLQQYKSWVYAAIFKRAQETAEIELKLFKKLKDDKFKEITVHPVLDLLDRVNESQTFTDLVNYTQTIEDLAGECFWWLPLNEKGQPTSIWPYLRPDGMTVFPDRDNFISHYAYMAQGGTESVDFDPEEIIHFKFCNPLDPYRGYSPVKAGELEISTNTKASEFNWAFFANNARPAGILNVQEKITEDQRDRLETQWNRQHKNLGNAHRMAIISGGTIDYKDIGFTQKDMDFKELKNMTRDEILAVFQVPLSILNPNESINRATAQVSKDVFIEQTIFPLMKRFTMTLNEFLLPLYGDDTLIFDFVNTVPENAEDKINKYNSGLTQGWLTVDEVRQMEGLGTLGTSAKSKKYHEPRVPYIRRTDDEQLEKELKKQISDKLGKTITKKIKKKRQNDKFEQIGLQFWKRKQATISGNKKKLQNKLRTTFNRQEAIVTSSYKDNGSIGLNVFTESEKLRTQVSPVMSDLVKQEYIASMKLMGNENFLTDAQFQDYINSAGTKYITAINKTTIKELERQITLGQQQNLPDDEILRNLRIVFESALFERAKTITDTELNRMSNWASQKAYEDSGVVDFKIWYTALDERVCPYCMPLHGKKIPTGENFFDLGDEFLGDAKTPLNLDFIDVPAPPLHTSCRCTLLPAHSDLF